MFFQMTGGVGTGLAARVIAGKRVRVLSLDGGGVRGLFSAHVLCRLKSELGEKFNVLKHTDMIAGTSTGGLLAVLLARGNEPEACVDVC